METLGHRAIGVVYHPHRSATIYVEKTSLIMNKSHYRKAVLLA